MSFPLFSLRVRPLRVRIATPAAVAASRLGAPAPASARAGVRTLLDQDFSVEHWAYDYADRLIRRTPSGRPVLVQTSMSPSGPFHVGNFRDTVTAHLVVRALRRRGRRARLQLGFDDFDPFRPRSVATSPELAPFASRPLADATSHSRAVCRAYVEELKALGICPPHADADGRTSNGVEWVTHYQAERYRAGEYTELQHRLVKDRAELATLLGETDDRNLFRAYCAQCGRNTTAIERLAPRRVTYFCQSCGARATSSDLRELKPAWAVDWLMRVVHEGIDCEPAGPDHFSAGSTMHRTEPVYRGLFGRPQPVVVPYGLVRQFSDEAKVSGSRGGGLRVADLLAVMPAQMVLWLYGRVNCRRDLRISLDLATMQRWYAQYDQFCRDAGCDPRATALWRLLTDEPPAPTVRLGFRRVVGAVQSQLFDLPAAFAGLGGSALSGDDQQALRERLVHARNWLAIWGRDHCWLPTREQPADGWRITDRMLDPGRYSDRHHPEEYHGFSMALFGTPTGPPLSRVIERFGAARVAEAMAAFQHDGSRPMREALEVALARREAPAWV